MEKSNFTQYIFAFFAGIFGAALVLTVYFAVNRINDITEIPGLNNSGLIYNSQSSQAVQAPLEPSIAEWDDYLTNMVDRVQPAVVAIAVTKDLPIYRRGFVDPSLNDFFDDPFFEYFFEDRSQTQAPQEQVPQDRELRERRVGGGSGFIASADGIVVTNNHVVDEADAEYTVVTSDGTEYEATVLARDPVYDLAYLKIEGDNFTYLEFGDSDSIELGQTVFAIGNALDEFQNTVTSGIVSGLNRTLMARTGFGTSEVIEQAIQTDAAINPGNSGGPLLDINGKVIGVNTAMSLQGQLIGFALPSNLVKRGLSQVQTTGEISRAWLGVRYQMIDQNVAEEKDLQVEYGALIVSGEGTNERAVITDSPADRAGLREYDIIVEVDGKRIEKENSLMRVINMQNPGDSINLKILRDGQEQTLSVTLDKRE